MRYSVILVAAGSGTRMHLGYNKVYYRLQGQTILEKSMQLFEADEDCRQVIVVTEPELYAREIGVPSAKDHVTAGGETRQASVARGLSLVREDVVLVHDAARPFLPRECLDALKKAMEKEEAACLMVPVKDTIKQVENGWIKRTIERSTLYAAQTPQAFRTALLKDCMTRAEAEGFTGTDDCSLVERYSSVKIRMVAGSYENRKLTTPEDLEKNPEQLKP
jgi:2-C-methyl-D-erythritol 4-phosphate cytidylyltransferase